MQLGPYQAHPLIEARFGLDGGAMFGIVPRPLWEREQPPDDRNRISLACRCLLLVGGGRVILVDTGIGDRWSDRERAIYAIRGGGGLPGSLAAHGLAPGDVTDVIQTHLHFDHAGGLCRSPDTADGDPVPRFPGATVHLQRRNWVWAANPSPRDAGSYRPGDWAPYRDGDDRLRLLDGAGEILPGIEAWPSDGHTPGQQLVRVRGGSGRPDLFYGGDLFPTRSHLRIPWNMGYDLNPLTVMEEKRRLLEEADRGGHWLMLEHDPRVERVRIRLDGHDVEVLEAVESAPGDPAAGATHER